MAIPKFEDFLYPFLQQLKDRDVSTREMKEAYSQKTYFSNFGDMRRQYEASQKEYWDYTSTLETAERKGEVKGALKEKEETVHRLIAMGLTIEQIAQGTNMSIDDVKRLLQ